MPSGKLQLPIAIDAMGGDHAPASVIDGAARGLLDFAAEIDIDRHGHPAALVVVTATGGGGKRTDGVHVVPITALGP